MPDHLKLGILLLLVLLFMVNSSLLAQVKVEREYSIVESKVPEKAVKFMHQAGLSDIKTRWFIETGIHDTTYEAKLTYRGKRYSIEFDSKGYLMDVEIVMDWNEIPTEVQANIVREFDRIFDRYTIRKIQIQYSGDYGAIARAIRNNFTGNNYTIHYEIVVAGKSGNRRFIYETLFSDSGQLLEKHRILQRHTLHLEQ